MLARSNLYQFLLLFCKRLCCLDISAALSPCTSGTEEGMFRFFICFQVFGDKAGLSNENASFFTRGEFPEIKKMYMKKLK